MVTSAGSILWGYHPVIKRSTDGGTNWNIVLNGAAGGSWWRMVQSPISGTIFVNSYDSTKNLYKSTDDGQNWTLSIDGTNPPGGIVYDHFHMVEVDQNGVVYVHAGDTNKYNLRSFDDGVTWEVFDTNYHPTSLQSFKDENNDVVLLWGGDYGNPVSIIRSINNATVPVFTSVFNAFLPKSQASYVQDIFTMKYLGDGVILGFVANDEFSVEYPHIVVSTDYGRTWRKIEQDNYSSSAYAGITFCSENSQYKKWILATETVDSWTNPVRSSLVTYGGSLSDIGR